MIPKWLAAESEFLEKMDSEIIEKVPTDELVPYWLRYTIVRHHMETGKLLNFSQDWESTFKPIYAGQMALINKIVDLDNKADLKRIADHNRRSKAHHRKNPTKLERYLELIGDDDRLWIKAMRSKRQKVDYLYRNITDRHTKKYADNELKELKDLQLSEKYLRSELNKLY